MNKIKIPETVQVGGIRYHVIYQNRLISNGAEAYGLCDLDKRQIILNTDYPEHYDKTFLHELIHTIEEKYHISLDEKQVDCLAQGLLDILVLNDIVVKE